MAEERDPLVSQKYRSLGAEEPPRELDGAILAASRRAAEKPHAPLVTPAGRHRWYFPLAAAAVVVLAVAVTVHLERQQPDPEVPPAAAPSATTAQEEGLGARKTEPAASPAPAAPPETSARSRERRDTRARPAPEAQPSREEARAAGAAADSAPKPMASPESRLAKLAEQAPEQWLEAIADLRREGRHAEADESLKRFRERYPDYRIGEEMKAKIERR